MEGGGRQQKKKWKNKAKGEGPQSPSLKAAEEPPSSPSQQPPPSLSDAPATGDDSILSSDQPTNTSAAESESAASPDPNPSAKEPIAADTSSSSSSVATEPAKEETPEPVAPSANPPVAQPATEPAATSSVKTDDDNKASTETAAAAKKSEDEKAKPAEVSAPATLAPVAAPAQATTTNSASSWSSVPLTSTPTKKAASEQKTEPAASGGGGWGWGSPSSGSSSGVGGGGWGGWSVAGLGKLANKVTAVASATASTAITLGKKFEELAMDDANRRASEDSATNPNTNTSSAVVTSPASSSSSSPSSAGPGQASPSSGEKPGGGGGMGVFWEAEELKFLTTIASSSLNISKHVATKGLKVLETAVGNVQEYTKDIISDDAAAVAAALEARKQAEAVSSSSSSSAAISQPLPPSDAPFEQWFDYFGGAKSIEILDGVSTACMRKVQEYVSKNMDKQKDFENGFFGLQSILDPAQFTNPDAGRAAASADERKKCAGIKFAEKLLVLRQEAQSDSTTAANAGDFEVVLVEALQKATFHVSRLSSVVLSHLSVLAESFDSNWTLPDWDPSRSSDVATKGEVRWPKTYSVAHGVREDIAAALSEVSQISLSFSDIVAKINAEVRQQMKAKRTKELEALNAKTREVKGELYVLQGKATSTVLDGFDKLVCVLKFVLTTESPLATTTTNTTTMTTVSSPVAEPSGEGTSPVESAKQEEPQP